MNQYLKSIKNTVNKAFSKNSQDKFKDTSCVDVLYLQNAALNLAIFKVDKLQHFKFPFNANVHKVSVQCATVGYAYVKWAKETFS